MTHMKDEGSMILMLLNQRDGLSTAEIKEDFYRFASQFGYGIHENHKHNHSKHGNADFFIYLEKQIEALEKEKLISRNGQKYQLTEIGKIRAKKNQQKFEQASRWVNKNIISAEATSRNTVIIDAILAILKLFAGIVSGSVGLIADGTDAALDTVSAGVVLWSVKKKKELVGTLVIIVMMFVTAIGLGIDSISSVVQNFTGEVEIISNPVLVIVIEMIALLFAILLMLYQRFTGKRERNFALITQSVDSKNHIYVAAAVITGAVLSMFGIILIDSLIGVYIAVKILIDAISLLKETLSSMQGEEIDFEKYDGILDKKWKENKVNSFRSVVLYHLLQNEFCTKDELINILHRNFKSSYLPVLSEFKIGISMDTDFEEYFEDIVRPLIQKDLIKGTGNNFSIISGKDIQIEEFVSNTLIEKFDSSKLKTHLNRLPHNDFDRFDGIGSMDSFLEKDEQVSSITRAKFKNGICSLLTSDKRVLIFSRKAKTCQSIDYNTITDTVEESGRFGTIKLTIIIDSESYCFDYMSPRRSFGFLSELHKHIRYHNNSLGEPENDDFFMKIGTLSKIQKYLVTQGIK